MTELRASGVTAGAALRWREGIRKSSPSWRLLEGIPRGPCALEQAWAGLQAAAWS